MKSIARFLTGFDAIIGALLIFQFYRYFEVQYLFEKFLPLSGSTRLIASILVSIVVVFILLIFSANLEKFKVSKSDSGLWVKWLIAGYTVFINAFFWSVYSSELHIDDDAIPASLVIAFKIIATLFFAGFDTGLCWLFISKYKDYQIEAGLERDISQLEKVRSELERTIEEEKVRLSELISKTCGGCGKTFETVQARSAHTPHCKANIE